MRTREDLTFFLARATFVAKAASHVPIPVSTINREPGREVFASIASTQDIAVGWSKLIVEELIAGLGAYNKSHPCSSYQW